MGLKLTSKGESRKLQKIVEALLDPPGRAIVTGSHVELFERTVRQWEAGKITFPGKNGIEDVGKFIFRTYDVRHERNSEESMTLGSIVSETYLYHTSKKEK